MIKDFEKAKWIWENEQVNPDEYAEFTFEYDFDGTPIDICLASDSNYYLTVNGKLAGFGQYADYPTFKVYDKIDLTAFSSLGKNNVVITVWYYGVPTQNYAIDNPGLIYELHGNGNVICYSGVSTQSRICTNYENHRQKYITTQLGLSYKYYNNVDNTLPFSDSVEVTKSYNLNIRPNKMLKLEERTPCKVSVKKDCYIVDLLSESVGFLDMDFDSDVEQTITVAYGEFLSKGNVRRYMHNNDFSIDFVAKSGNNKYINCFRRFGCRYLQIFTEHPITINYMGIRPTNYDVVPVESNFRSAKRNKIFKTSQKTLLCCMHEHFEDCPWREQALYTMDSRNEALCSYYGFNNYEFARSNLQLIAKGLTEFGLLSICYPTTRDIPIPFFSLAYPLEVYEYIENSGDKTILDEAFPVIKTIIKTFESRIEDNGLIANFPYPFWNFYEWSDGSSNGDQISRKKDDFYPHQYDLILNCMYLYALGYYQKLCAMQNEKYDCDTAKMKDAIKKTFFDSQTNLYKANSLENCSLYTTLGNSLAVLVGLGDESTIDTILKSKTVVPITLSMNTFIYDAMLKTNAQKYKKFILKDIDKKYSNMLKYGATTFWETEEGPASLAHTGSLCHGWSAMPIYYYLLLNGKEYFDGKL